MTTNNSPCRRCFASIDVGQTYLATCIYVLKTDTDTHQLYELVHIGIDELVPGHSAPHQPVKIIEGGEMVGKKKAAASGSGASIKLSEMRTVQLVGSAIHAYVQTWGVDTVFVEDQLDGARRNRMVQAAIVSACAAQLVVCVSVAPLLKMQMCSVQLQEVMQDALTLSKSNLKNASFRVARYIADSGHTLCAWNVNVDLQHFDPASTQCRLASSFDCHNEWYHKDISDCFLQALAAVNMLMKK